MKAYNKLHLTQSVNDILNRKKQRATNKDNSLNSRLSLIEVGGVKRKQVKRLSDVALKSISYNSILLSGDLFYSDVL